MNKEDYVSYDLALALKAAGFDEPCDHFFDGHGNLNRYADTDIINRNTNGHHTPSCSAPSLWHAQKWLREKKELFIEVSPNFGMRARATFGITSHDFTLFDSRGHIINDMDRSAYPSYEAALSAGITAVLELIKKGE